MEKLFCQKTNVPPKTVKRQNSCEKKSDSQVSLLDSRRSLSIGIFLKQFKGGMEDIVEKINLNKHAEIGAEKLRTLIQLLPDSNELQILRSYSGNVKALGLAEQFVLKISNIENCAIRVEGMLLLEELPSTIRTLHDHAHSMLDACRILITNESLKKFLALILVHGNFMNSGSYAGNAVGFRLTTLPKLLETRANNSRITLLHYLVEVAQQNDPDILDFTLILLQSLSKCSKLTLENLNIELSNLSKSLNKLDDGIKNGNKYLKKHFQSFVQDGKRRLTALEKKITEIQDLSTKLAKRFCEDENKFQLEECLSIFYNFCLRVKVVQAENEEFKANEEKRKSHKIERQRKVETV